MADMNGTVDHPMKRRHKGLREVLQSYYEGENIETEELGLTSEDKIQKLRSMGERDVGTEEKDKDSGGYK
jgi:hypothetical protein